jgi:acetylornithine deacetylase/succinyl-diaminopimelate desuccinylase-like protein
MRNFQKACEEILGIRSVSTEGTEAIANHVSAIMQDRGLKTVVQQAAHSIDGVSKRQFNVIGILGDPLVDRKTRKGLLLLTHLDTASPGAHEAWNECGGNPFDVRVRDGEIFGLGAASGKLDFLCRVRAIEKFRERKLRQPVYLVATSGAELGMFGARYLLKSLALNPVSAVVTEPTGLKLGVAHKSSSVYRVQLRYPMIERDPRGFNRPVSLRSFGRAALGAFPHLGMNAIEQAIGFLRAASDAGFEIRFTQIHGGALAMTQVPDRASVDFFLTAHQLEDFKRFFRENVGDHGKKPLFELEAGGHSATGVRFLPDAVFTSVLEILDFFKRFGLEIQSDRNADFDPPYSTVSLAGVQQSAAGMDLFFDVRWLPDFPAADVEKVIHAGIRRLAERYPGLNVTVHRERAIGAMQINLSSQWLRDCEASLRSAGLDVAMMKGAAATEAALCQEAGFDALFFGPGLGGGNTHGPNERVSLDQLEKAVLFYEKLIERVCL